MDVEARGMGPRRSGRRERRRRTPSPTREELRTEAERRRSRAHEELLDVRAVPGAPFAVFDVANPLHGSRYRVYVPRYPDFESASCDCPDYGQRGLGTCKHLEAVELWAADARRELGPPDPRERSARAHELWAEVDRALASMGEGTAPRSVRWRKAGRALIAGSAEPI